MGEMGDINNTHNVHINDANKGESNITLEAKVIILDREEIRELFKLVFLGNELRQEVNKALAEWLTERILEDPLLRLKFLKKQKALEVMQERLTRLEWLKWESDAITEAESIIINELADAGVKFLTLPVGQNEYKHYYTINSILHEGADAKLISLVGKITGAAKVSKARTRNLLLARSAFIEWEDLNPPGYIPLADEKILDLETLTLHDKLEGKYFTVKAGVTISQEDLNQLKEYLHKYSWDEGEEYLLAQAPNYAKAYLHVFNTEELRRQAREMIGAIFFEGVLRKAWIVVGDPGIGKSVIADALRSALGDLASSLSLVRLFGEENRLVTGELAGKYANISSESPESMLKAVDWFKVLTGDRILYGEVKYRRPFKFRNRVKLITFCNQLPLFSRVDVAVLDRLYIIESEAESIPEESQDKDLAIKAKQELKHVFLHILWCYKELEARNFKLLYAPDRERVQDLIMERAALLSDFVEACCETGEEYLEKGQDIYQAYLAWCREAGIVKPLGRNTFYAQLSYMGFERIVKKRNVYFKGLKLLKEEKPVETPLI